MKTSTMMLVAWAVWILLAIYRSYTADTQADVIFAACNLVSSNVFLAAHFISLQIERSDK